MKQDNMNQLNLFEKFSQINTQSTTSPGIHEEDSDYCNRVQAEYQKIMDSLHNYRALFTSLEEQDNLSGSLDILSKDLLYSPARTLATVEKLIEEARETFVKKVVSHFADKYYLLKINHEDLLKQEDVTAAKVAARILSQYEDLEHYGKQTIKTVFHSTFSSTTRPTLTNSKITIPRMFHYSYTWDGKGMYFHYDCIKQIDILARVISLFETGTCYQVIDTIPGDLPSCNMTGKINFQQTFGFTGCRKIKGIKLFKNNRADLVFHSPAFAREFFDTFECKDLYFERGCR